MNAIIDENLVPAYGEKIVAKIIELDIQHNDLHIFMDDVEALTLAVVSKNKSLVNSAFSYLVSARDIVKPFDFNKKKEELHAYVMSFVDDEPEEIPNFPKEVEAIARTIFGEFMKLGFRNTDPKTCINDTYTLAYAIALKNQALINGAFSYLMGGRGFAPTVDFDRKRVEFYNEYILPIIHQIDEEKEES